MTGYLIHHKSLEAHARLGAPLRQKYLTWMAVHELEETLRGLCEATGHHYRLLETPLIGGTGRAYWCVVCGDWFFM